MNTSTTEPVGTTRTSDDAAQASAELAVRPAASSVQPPPGAVRAPSAPRDTLSDDVRSSLLLIAATAAFALAVVALGTLASGVPG
jgi:hypothetical protein